MLKKREILKKKKRSPSFQCRGHRFGKAQKKKKKKTDSEYLGYVGGGWKWHRRMGHTKEKMAVVILYFLSWMLVFRYLFTMFHGLHKCFT